MAATRMYRVEGKGSGIRPGPKRTKYDPKRKGRSISPARAKARQAGKTKKAVSKLYKGVSTETKNRAGMGKTIKKKLGGRIKKGRK